MHIAPNLLSTTIVAALLPAPAVANKLTDTLKKIKDTGTITLGRRDASIPFSYLGTEPGKPISYSHNLQLKVVETVKKELNLPSLKVHCNLVTSQTRIPLVRNGTVDTECGSTASNKEHQKQVNFSVGIFKVGTRLLSRKTTNIKDFDDLKGKNVMVTAGTTSERLLKTTNTDKKMDINIISAKDHGEPFMMLKFGRAVVFMIDDALLYDEMAKAKKPDDWVVGGTPQSFEIYSCMVRKGDAAFKEVVDKAITSTYASDEADKICDKWFTQPIPPKGLNLDFSVSEELRKLIANPTDKTAEQM